MFTYSYAANAPLCQIVNFRSTSAGLVACFQSPKQEVPYCPVLNENANSNNWLYFSYMDSFTDLTRNYSWNPVILFIPMMKAQLFEKVDSHIGKK